MPKRSRLRLPSDPESVEFALQVASPAGLDHTEGSRWKLRRTGQVDATVIIGVQALSVPTGRTDHGFRECERISEVAIGSPKVGWRAGWKPSERRALNRAWGPVRTLLEQRLREAVPESRVLWWEWQANPCLGVGGGAKVGAAISQDQTNGSGPFVIEGEPDGYGCELTLLRKNGGRAGTVSTTYFDLCEMPDMAVGTGWITVRLRPGFTTAEIAGLARQVARWKGGHPLTGPGGLS